PAAGPVRCRAGSAPPTPGTGRSAPPTRPGRRPPSRRAPGPRTESPAPPESPAAPDTPGATGHRPRPGTRPARSPALLRTHQPGLIPLRAHPLQKAPHLADRHDHLHGDLARFGGIAGFCEAAVRQGPVAQGREVAEAA